MKDVGERKPSQSRTNDREEIFYYREMLRGSEVMKSRVLKELELRAKGMIEWKAVSDRVTSCDAARRKRVAELERRMETSEGQPAIPKTAPRKN